MKKKKGKGTRAGDGGPFPGISREVERVRGEGRADLEKGGGKRSSRGNRKEGTERWAVKKGRVFGDCWCLPKSGELLVWDSGAWTVLNRARRTSTGRQCTST